MTTTADEATAESPVARSDVRRAEVAALTRHRVAMIETTLSPEMLVQRTLARYDQTFGDVSHPVDLDGWVRRTLREVVLVEQRVQQQAADALGGSTELSTILEGLAAPVRAPALAKHRRLLLRRVSALVGGSEARVLLAMITARSLDRVADRFGIAPLDVARLQRRALQRLQDRLDDDPQLIRQLREASRQPQRARTSPKP